MKSALLASLSLSLVVSACASTRQATSGPAAPLCKTEPGMLECLVEALAAKKPAEVRKYCQEIEGKNENFDFICTITSPVSYWMEGHKEVAKSLWDRDCHGAPLTNRADAVVFSVLIYAKALEMQGYSVERLTPVLVDATLAFSAGCGVPREATGALLAEAGNEMTQKGVAWPDVACQRTPACMAALQP